MQSQTSFISLLLDCQSASLPTMPLLPYFCHEPSRERKHEMAFRILSVRLDDLIPFKISGQDEVGLKLSWLGFGSHAPAFWLLLLRLPEEARFWKLLEVAVRSAARLDPKQITSSYKGNLFSPMMHSPALKLVTNQNTPWHRLSGEECDARISTEQPSSKSLVPARS